VEGYYVGAGTLRNVTRLKLAPPQIARAYYGRKAYSHGRILMHVPHEDTNVQARLRVDAEERLSKGTAPPTRGWPTGAQALAHLYTLASSPATASDAQKLLHELQVHQVELDLQHEQADLDRLQLAEELENHVHVFDLAPFGYLTLDAQARVVAANRIGAAWLGVPRDVWAGCRIEELLAPESRKQVAHALDCLRNGSARESCTAQSKTGGSSVQLAVSAAHTGRRFLMAFMPSELTSGK
jgi:PAS domain-containing protein